MKLLIVKTSSMGDVIHTLPAVTDAARALPGIVIDWVVEEGFAEIPRWHPAVRRVIPVALRRWRKTPLASLRSDEWKQFRGQLAAEHYDCIIDAQGLVKSALVARLAHGPVSGFDWSSAREPLASLFYQKKFSVSKQQHAVERIRSLFGQALCYHYAGEPADCALQSAFHHALGNGDFGLQREQFGGRDQQQPYVLFLHGTTRGPKHWPDTHWLELCRLVSTTAYQIKVPWYTPEEKQRAEKMSAVSDKVQILPKTNLQGMATALARASAFVAVDTGLGHLGAALDVPGISLYGPTSPTYVGTYGRRQIHMGAKAPGDTQVPGQDSLSLVSADGVWRELQKLLQK